MQTILLNYIEQNQTKKHKIDSTGILNGRVWKFMYSKGKTWTIVFDIVLFYKERDSLGNEDSIVS